MMSFKSLLFLPLYLAIGCATNTPQSISPTNGHVSVVWQILTASKNRDVSKVASVSVTVTGPEIATSIVKNLTFDPATNTWSASFDVPIGIDRVFTVVAKDVNGNPLYSGSTTSDVKPDVTTPINVDLWWDPTSKGQFLVSVGFDNPYLGIGKVGACVGFFIKSGQSPDTGTILPESQYQAICALAKKYCNVIRIYNADELAVKSANAIGLDVWLGVWIGKDDAANQIEIAKAVSIANRYKVKGIVVGNEVMLNNYQTEDEMVAYVLKIRSQTSNLQITCADTWDMWWNGGNGRPKLAAVCDLIMIHCWPYWEGVGLDLAVASVADHYRKITGLYTSKPVIIGETGWPTGGTQFGNAVPSELGQRIFIRQIVEWARINNAPFLLFELVNEPYKNEPYGVGPNWGLFTSDLVIKPEIGKIWF